jgi:hypothetical protein
MGRKFSSRRNSVDAGPAATRFFVLLMIGRHSDFFFGRV